MSFRALAVDAARAFGLPLHSLAPELSGLAPAPVAGLDWASLDPHALGELHQRGLRSESSHRKAAGAFYTPPGVARLLAAEAVPLAPVTDGRLPTVFDPACGCGSLLIEALRYLCRKRGAAPLKALSVLRGQDRDLASVVLARLALLTAAAQLGAGADDLPALAELLAANLRVRDFLLDDDPASADCLLLNPPYVRAARGTEDRQALRRRFPSATGAFDLHVPFLEAALRAVRREGVLGLLTTNKWLVADYGRALRREMARETTILRLIDLADCPDADASALVSQVVLVARRSPAGPQHQVELLHPRTLSECTSSGGRPVCRAQAALLLSRWPLLFGGAKEERLVAHMTSGTFPRLADLATVRGGARGFDYRACCRELREATGAPDEVLVLCPGNVRAYRAPSDGPVRLLGREWTAPCWRRRPASFSESLWELCGQTKLVVKGVGSRPTAALVLGPAAPLVAVWGVWAPEDTLWLVLALLNSRPVAWLHYQQLQAARIPRGSLRIPLSWLAALPVPPTRWLELGELARRRCAATTAEDRRRLQAQIDVEAAEAYGLDEAARRLLANAPLRDIPT